MEEQDKKNTIEVAEKAKVEQSEEKLVRIVASEKVSILFPEHGTKGEDILVALAHLAGMYLTARPDAEYRENAKRLLKATLTYVTCGEWERGKNLRESKKIKDAEKQTEETDTDENPSGDKHQA